MQPISGGAIELCSRRGDSVCMPRCQCLMGGTKHTRVARLTPYPTGIGYGEWKSGDSPKNFFGYRLDDALIYKIVDIDGSGLLERYNFTIREDTPFDVDVAVDPEMLGKVYESLIQEEERGEVGIFYTPRIEVDFMCRQSILEYLVENTSISQDKLISFIYSTEEDSSYEVYLLIT